MSTKMGPSFRPNFPADYSWRENGRDWLFVCQMAGVPDDGGRDSLRKLENYFPTDTSDHLTSFHHIWLVWKLSNRNHHFSHTLTQAILVNSLLFPPYTSLFISCASIHYVHPFVSVFPCSFSVRSESFQLCYCLSPLLFLFFFLSSLFYFLFSSCLSLLLVFLFSFVTLFIY
jgi:hypothetical protein